MRKYFILVSLAIILISSLSLLGCERDDICAEATPTTPRLIIRFYDINNPETLKQVRQLEVVGLDEDDTPLADLIISREDTDSINLPLNFQLENEVTTSRFQLKLNSDFDDNENEDVSSNSDRITVTYTPEFLYVSRACGYKSIFNLAEILPITKDGVEDGDVETWIRSFEILNQTIDNENAAQIIIYH